MTIISTAPREWRPVWITENPPLILWRVATVIERDLFEGSLAQYNALPAMPWVIDNQFRTGLAALLPDDPDRVASLCELRSRLSADEALTPHETALYDEAVAALMEYWPGYRAIVAQAAKRESLLPTLAFQKFVTGWEGLTFNDDPVAYQRGIDMQITDDVMAQVDPMIIRSLGLEIYRAMYDRSAEKNSAPPSPSGGGRRTSKAKTRRAGKSAQTDGQ